MNPKNTIQTNKFSFNSITVWLSIILLVTLVSFYPSLKNGFTNWDDNKYIAENPLITNLSTENIKNIFSSSNPVALNYHPITILSYAIDYKLAKYNPYQYHLSNLLFHLLNTALVFAFAYLLSNKKLRVATTVSILWGIHPMHVESVAWISERKDVLYVCFFLAGLIFYMKYIGTEGKKMFLLYLVTLLLFLLSVLSKAMAVVFPLVLLLIDYYKGQKFEAKLFIEKIPYFIISIYYGVIATQIQATGGAIVDVYNFFQRFEFACYGLLNYVMRLIVPFKLSCFYPYPNTEEPLPLIFHLYSFIVIFSIGLSLWKFRKNKDFIFGTLFFIITIALVLQFITVGKVVMADRYSYLAYVGLLFSIAMYNERLQQGNNKNLELFKKVNTPLLIGFTLVLALQSFQRCKIWKNSDTLWTDAINKYPNSNAYQSRASYLVNKSAIDIDKTDSSNEYERALSDYSKAIELKPQLSEAYTGRANIYSIFEKYDLALNDYSKAISFNENDADIYFNRAGAYNLMQKYSNAINDYTKALSINPNLTSARENRSRVNVTTNNFTAAIGDLDTLILLNPDHADYYFYRCFSLSKIGKYPEALQDNTKAIELNPQIALWYMNRSYIYYSMGLFQNAFDEAKIAMQKGYTVDEVYLQQLKSKIK